MKSLLKPLLIAAFACSVMHSSPFAMASDHFDAPSLSGNGQQDINDLYAFRPSTTSSNSALILTVNPFAGSSSPTTFATDTAYRFEVDTNGDALSDITYETTFGAAAVNGSQGYTLTRNGTAIATGVTGINQTVSTTSGAGTVVAGTFDDPFFFDLAGFQNTLNGTGSFTGEDAFAGVNVSAIVLEIPSADFGATDIGVWATTTQGGVQIDRAGRPAINTVLVSTDELKEAFNAASPENDFTDFGAEVSTNITGLSNQENADALTGVLLPDILTFNTANSDGFLNGRRLNDDVIDASLGLLTDGGITTDLVDANDVQFNSVFPFLAAAQPAAVPEPSSALVIAVAFGTCLTRRRRKS